jgi:hypothetical protein
MHEISFPDGSPMPIAHAFHVSSAQGKITALDTALQHQYQDMKYYV